MFIFVMVLLFSFCFKNVSASELCSLKGYTVLTINGIFTNKDGAIQNKDSLKDHFLPTYNNEPLTVDYLYNPTHLAGAGDLIDAVKQGFFDQKSDYDLIEMLNDASQKVTTQKLLLVAHSQGNFYANNFYDKVADKEGGVPSQSIGVYGVGSPANKVAGDGKYVTSDTDNVVATMVARFIKILPTNVHISLSGGDDNNGHDFSKVYLKYQGDRIVSDVKSSLDKLKNNDEQDSRDPCISPPELSMIHKIEGLAFAVADPTANFTKTVVTNTIVGSYQIASAFGNGVLSGVSAVANSVSSFTKSIFNIPKNLATNISANAIFTIEQLANTANTSQNNIPEPAKENVSPQVKTAEATPPPDTIVVSVPNIVPTVPITPASVAIVVHNGGGRGAPILQTESETSPVETLVEDPILPAEEKIIPVIPPVDKVSPVITIIGDNPFNIIKGTTYVDAGATALDDVDGDITANIITVNPVNVNIIGDYTITYNVKDAVGNSATQIIRLVHVVAPLSIPDITAPVITALGNNPETVMLGSNYSDAGATAIDDVDGPISVNAIGSVNTKKIGVYTITYTTTDLAGNTSTLSRDVKVSSFVYIPKYSFGADNGDGRDWQVWNFNGSNVYDWSDTYVDNYLREQFKIQTYPGGYWCSQCLQRGIFNHDPEQGFELADMIVSSLENNPQNNMNGMTYDVSLQWDSTGYTYTISHGSVVDSTGHTDVANMNNDLWVGWNSAFNNLNFQIFPVGSWQGIVPNSPLNRTGGNSMMLQPYPVYKNQSAPTIPTLAFPTFGPFAGDGIDPSRGRANLTPFAFQVVYTDPNNNAPQNVTLHIINASTGISVREINMYQTPSGSDILSDGNFANGELYITPNSIYGSADYEYYFTAKDSLGDNMQIPENNHLKFSVIPSTYIYIPKYSFGVGNGDGHDWQVWTFNGSNVYDWRDVYVDHYLNQQFKVQHYGSGVYYTSSPLIKGIFTHNPLLGFESSDILRTDTIDRDNNPQNGRDGIYDVNIQWDSAGYTTTVLYNSNTVTVDAVHTDISNVDSNMWVGWGDLFNNFQTFPSGNWIGASGWFPLGYSGGNRMILQPYKVYDPSQISSDPNSTPINKNSAKAITAFNFSSLTTDVTDVIDETNHTISLTVPFGTDVKVLAPTITISDKALISPNTSVAQDFTNPVTYTVTASDGSTQNYVVTVLIAPDPNPLPDTTPPVLVSAKVTSANIIEVTFSKDINGTTVNTTDSEFAVTGHTVSSVHKLTGGIIILTLSTNIKVGETLSITFTSTNFKDLAGNQAVSPATVIATNNMVL